MNDKVWTDEHGFRWRRNPAYNDAPLELDASTMLLRTIPRYVIVDGQWVKVEPFLAAQDESGALICVDNPDYKNAHRSGDSHPNCCGCLARIFMFMASKAEPFFD